MRAAARADPILPTQPERVPIRSSPTSPMPYVAATDMAGAATKRTRGANALGRGARGGNRPFPPRYQRRIRNAVEAGQPRSMQLDREMEIDVRPGGKLGRLVGAVARALQLGGPPALDPLGLGLCVYVELCRRHLVSLRSAPVHGCSA